LPLPPGVRPTLLTVVGMATPVGSVPPIQDACLTCHDDAAAAAHAATNTAPGGSEACPVCHGESGIEPVSTVHASLVTGRGRGAGVLVQERERRAGWMGLIVLLAVTSVGGGRRVEAQTAPPPSAGLCGNCHYDFALAYTFPGGHAPALDCIACHGDRRPGRVGKRHRTIPDCGTCHDDVHGHPAKTANRTGRTQTRNCPNCHDPHGTTNHRLGR